MPALKFNGKAFGGLFGDAVVLKLDRDAHEKALNQGAVLFDPSGMGRPMKQWVVLPAAQHNELAQAGCSRPRLALRFAGARSECYAGPMGDRWSVVAVGMTLALATGCPRVERVAPMAPQAECQPEFCGGEVAVRTSLAVGAPLTSAECKSVCASIWCDADPLGALPGCRLFDPQTVSCAAIAYDCGHIFGGPCGPGNCSGCCDQGICTNALGSCGGASCTECSGCSVAACSALAACGVRLEAEPRISTCADADGGVPSVDLTTFCPAACFSSGAGPSVQCAQGLGGTCADGGFEAQCVPDAGPPSSCESVCADTRESCEQACPRSSFSECIACSAGCGVAWGRCRASCPP